MKELFDKISRQCSRLVTQAYSTSFSMGICCLDKSLRDPIHAIYGFVRFADEIVDSFHDYAKPVLFRRFREDTYLAIQERISLNPILNNFQHTVHQYKIETALVEQFLKSMETDLVSAAHDVQSFEAYIFGSAEVVGLMCLRVFCSGNEDRFEKLKPYAMSLGSAFQKVNFLRDLKADYIHRGRSYFPGLKLNQLDENSKKRIETSIAKDFNHAYTGIKQLPRKARLGVYVAYVYYLALFKKIRNTPSERVLQARIRIRNRHKATLLAYSYVKHQLDLM